MRTWWTAVFVTLLLAGIGAGSVVSVVEAATQREQLTPATAYHTERGDYLVVYVEDRGRGRDLYAKRLYANGLPQGGPAKNGWAVIRSSGYGADTPGERVDPSLFYNGQTDEFMLVFSEYISPDDGFDVFAVRLSAAGYARTKPRLIAGGPGDQQHPDVALESDSRSGGGSNQRNYLVVWDDNARDLDEVWGVRLRSNGIALGKPLALVRGEALGANAKDPTTNGSVLAWTDDRNGSTEIWGLRLQSGRPNGAPYALVTGDSDVFSPRYGQSGLVWNTFDFNTGIDIQGVQVYDNGRTRGSSFGILVPAADQSWPDVARGLVVFSDNRSGENDLYAVRINTVNSRVRGREFVVLSDRSP